MAEHAGFRACPPKPTAKRGSELKRNGVMEYRDGEMGKRILVLRVNFTIMNENIQKYRFFLSYSAFVEKSGLCGHFKQPGQQRYGVKRQIA
jgi:hypothetical protein